jgi:uncharacterized protein (TIGR04255 family)
MPFPERPRVIFKNSVLDNVICQVRFPPILKIDSEVPSVFQDSIREKFPLYNEKVEQRLDLPSPLKDPASGVVMSSFPKPTIGKNHEFATEDGIWKAYLTRTFLSFTTSKYVRWEEFKERFSFVFASFLSTYKPPFFTRIGLRYVDIFDRSKLNLKDAHWNDLLQPYILGLLASPIESSIRNCVTNHDVALSDNQSFVRIATSFVYNMETKEQCFKVDSDFHLDRNCPPENAIAMLDFFNSKASRLIQWMITDKLRTALEPQAQ